MAINPKLGIPVRHETVFGHGCALVTEVVPVMEFKDGKSTGRQDRDEESGLLVWSCTVMDGDPEVKGPSKAVKVKLLADYQPVPPDPVTVPGTSMRVTPVEFDGLMVKPYPVEVMAGRFKVAYSISARGLAAPATG